MTRKLGKALYLLPLIGAINWGLMGLFRFNLVESLFGARRYKAGRFASRLVYGLVGLSGLSSLFPIFGDELKQLPKARWYGRAVHRVADMVS